MPIHWERFIPAHSFCCTPRRVKSSQLPSESKQQLNATQDRYAEFEGIRGIVARFAQKKSDFVVFMQHVKCDGRAMEAAGL